jgi:hypothetical protein
MIAARANAAATIGSVGFLNDDVFFTDFSISPPMRYAIGNHASQPAGIGVAIPATVSLSR